MAQPISCDQERVSFNLARLRKQGLKFEVAVDPDLAIKYKKGEISDIRDVLKQEKIFADVKKGLLASEHDMQNLFQTIDSIQVAEKILKDGEIQLTAEYRAKIREEKKNRIIHLIHRNAIDPKTRLPHPLTRFENAFEQLKIHLDDFKSAEEQVDDVLKKLQTIMPIKIETLIVKVDIPPQFAHQSYGIMKKYGKIKEDTWGTDGGLITTMELPAGLQEELLDQLNNLTHGGATMEVIKEK